MRERLARCPSPPRIRPDPAAVQSYLEIIALCILGMYLRELNPGTLLHEPNKLSFMKKNSKLHVKK